MTNPNLYPTFTAVVPDEERKRDRDPNEFIPWTRITEMVTPRGVRPGKLLIVRPLKQIEDFRKRDDDGWKGTLVVADIACLDPIEPAQDEYGMPLPGFPAGHQFRNQVVFPGFLNKAFRSYVDKTLLGLTYLGPNTKGKPPFMWRDLSGDQNAVMRAQQFFATHPEFLVPVIDEVQPDPVQQGYAPAPQQGYQYQQDPWAQQQQLVQGQPQAPVAPPAYPQQGYGQPAQMQQAPQSAPPMAAPVSPAAAQRPLNTLDQLRQHRETNHHGQPQSSDTPF